MQRFVFRAVTEETKHVRGVPRERHSLPWAAYGFCPETPAPEKRREKKREVEEKGIGDISNCGKKIKRRTLKGKEKEALESMEGQHTAKQFILVPVPATSAGRVFSDL